jgi:hypothetical protein
MSTPPSPNDLTRQQLDELDALLQRMLSLPLSGPPTPVPVPSPVELPVPTGVSGSWRSDGPTASTRSPYLAAQPLPAVAPFGAVAPELDRPLPPEADWGPDPLARYTADPAQFFGPATAETGIRPSTVRGVDAPALPMDFRSAFADPLVGPAPVSTPIEEPGELAPLAAVPFVLPNSTPANQPAPLPVLGWPLFAVNWVLECLLGLLGPVGTAIRHPAIKHPLGWLGVLLIVAAGVWSARGMGWVQFPLPLPLPR